MLTVAAGDSERLEQSGDQQEVDPGARDENGVHTKRPGWRDRVAARSQVVHVGPVDDRQSRCQLEAEIASQTRKLSATAG
ncbi:MAG: hypothetical protein ACT4OF_05035 [Caulobacteraceae bacterium]